jgi:dihydrofolate synthase/folylpolyglutamate synthase
MDYRAALVELDRHVNLEARAGRIEGLSLDVITALMAALGDPQRAYPVLHVTGTNGKGSVVRMASALLREHGLVVGSYTSPHLARVNERLAWDLEPIADDAFAAAISAVVDVAPLAGVEPSYFELLTAAALAWFAEVAVDAAVVEVGLLGRYDATNVVDSAVAVVTNVARDHTDGGPGWRREVAAEKAGIVGPGSVLVLGEDDPELLPVFEAEAPAVLLVAGEDFAVESDVTAVGGRLIDVRTPAGRYTDVFLPFYGAHQAANAAVAITAVEAFFGRALDEDVVRDAFASLTLPGRFEVLARGPLVVVDGAHNAAGAAAAAETLSEEFEVGRKILVVGLLAGAGRAVPEILEALDAGRADLVVACAPDSPRAVPAAEVGEVARALGAEVEVVDDPAAAVRRALAVADEGDAVLVAGSLYLVTPARAALAAFRA